MYPIPAREADRIDCLHELGILFSEPSEPFNRICELITAQFGTPTAFVSFVDRSSQWFKARIGLDLAATSREVAFCAHTILSDEVLVIEDALKDDRFRSNPLVTAEPRIRFYAGAPLIYAPGLRIGTVCAVDRKPRTFDARQRRLLAAYASIAVSELRLIAASRLIRKGFDEQARLQTALASLRRHAG